MKLSLKEFRKRLKLPKCSFTKLGHLLRFVTVAIVYGVLTNNCFEYFVTKSLFPAETSFLRKNGKYVVDSGIASSVWCNKDPGDSNHKTCLFKNLCWLPTEEQFVFFLGSESIVSGLEDWSRLSSLDFSSVAGHNRFTMKLTVIPNLVNSKHPLSKYLLYQEDEWVYFLWRFKPDNVMHVLHDDLLPLFAAFEAICGGNVEQCVDKYKLIFVDDTPNEAAYDLYRLFTNGKSVTGGKPIYVKKNWSHYHNSTICFSHARVGLPRETLWYQYGFGRPQGPIKNINLSMALFKKFGSFLIKQMKIPVSKEVHAASHEVVMIPPRALYITRSISRRILNELDLIDVTKKVYSEEVKSFQSLRVDFLNPATNSSSSGMKEILKALLKWPPPYLILGMHGAALTVATFLSLATINHFQSIAVLELFPLGIDANAVSPIRALLETPWLDNSNYLLYESWTNPNPSKSFMPSTYLNPLQGGGDFCQGVKLNSVLPAVHCCHNREYICRMFQDTEVEFENGYSEKLRTLLLRQEKIKERWSSESYIDWQWYFPGPVINISCNWDIESEIKYLKLNWREPLNVFKHSYHYEVAVILETSSECVEPLHEISSEKNSPSSEGNRKEYFLNIMYPEALLLIPQNFLCKSQEVIKAFIWIQCVVALDITEIKKEIKSLDTYQECSISL